MKVYCVTVPGYGSALYHARTPSAARYEAYLSDAFSHLTFREFVGLAGVRRAAPAGDGYARLRQQYPDAVIPEPGTKIRAEGLTGTVLPALRSTSYVIFQPDGQAREAMVHPASVALAEAPQ